MYWTSFYAALLGFIYFYLSMSVIKRRWTEKVSIGDGQDEVLRYLIRRHANFIEYVPMALILLFLSESNGAGFWLVHIAGITLLVGRLLHAYSFSVIPPKGKIRVLGMQLTFISIFIGAISNLYVVLLGQV